MALVVREDIISIAQFSRDVSNSIANALAIQYKDTVLPAWEFLSDDAHHTVLYSYRNAPIRNALT